MEQYNIEVANQAKLDLHEIFSYISYELKEPVIAYTKLNVLDKAILSLKEMPERYPLVPDYNLSKKGIRKLVAESYIIFYKIYEKTKMVKIVRILNARRDWLFWINKEI